MKGLAEAGEQRGERKDFKGREREKLQRRKKKEVGGLVTGERWQDIEVSERKVRTSDRGRVRGRKGKKTKTQGVQNKIAIQRERQAESKMTGPRYTQAKEDEKGTESTFYKRGNMGATRKTGGKTEMLKTKLTELYLQDANATFFFFVSRDGWRSYHSPRRGSLTASRNKKQAAY